MAKRDMNGARRIKRTASMKKSGPKPMADSNKNRTGEEAATMKHNIGSLSGVKKSKGPKKPRVNKSLSTGPRVTDRKGKVQNTRR